MKKSKLFMAGSLLVGHRPLALLILVFVCVLLSSAAFADRLPQFKSFPTLGRCNGTSVRLREDPSTESEILGKLNTSDVVVVLDKFVTDGATWYEIDNPFDEGSAFVFGKYLEACYMEDYQEKPLHKLIMNLYLTFGVTPEKALKISGKPKKQERENVGSDNLERVYLTYKNFTLEYLDNSLTGVDVSGGKKTFGDIKIGDDADKVIEAFGEPTSKEENHYGYQESEMTFISFELKNNKVSKMNYQVYYDIE